MSESTQPLRLCFKNRGQYSALRAALALDEYSPKFEEGAFLFASPMGTNVWNVVDIKPLRSEDYAMQRGTYVELQEDVLQALILRAHRTHTALIEAHSHPFTGGPRVSFSAFDREELAELAPHVAWRLPGRPFVALVFGRVGFDSLYWEGRGRKPKGHVDLLVCGRVLHASRESERLWSETNG